MENQIYGDILIRNIDASYLYWKIKDDAAIREYEREKKKLSAMGSKEENKAIEEKVEKLANQIFSFKPEITLPRKDTRYMYSGTLTDSLMTRHLREVVKDTDDTIRMDSTAPGTAYTDVIINLKFKSDVIIQTDENKKKYNNETGIIEETEEKKNKCLLSAEKLRKLAYRDGITINGVHYVNFQRTSSKARTGNCLFIDDKYFDAMEKWQTMDIPFREIFEKDDKIDIVSTRSYESLTSSSIIGTIDIDPYSILLIDEADGTATMPCNVVTLNPDTKRLQVAKQDYEKHIDLWDGQSLADESIFENGTYVDRKDGQEHSYKDKGFLLLRNHFFKSAIFNARLQAYYKEVFTGIENPIVKNRFENEFNPFAVKLVTTKNSVKILKFAHVVAKYMVDDSKKDKLKELESELEKFENECSEIKNRVSVAKRNLTILQKKDEVTLDQLRDTQQKMELAIQDQGRVHEIDVKIKRLNKAVKFEEERLTWDWYREQLKKNQDQFGVCKYEKTSKFGDRQQLWYQVLDSLNLNEDQLWKIVEPQVNEINLMRKYPAFLKHSLNIKASDSEKIGSRMMKEMLQVNEDITRTKWYTDFRHSYVSSILDQLYAGKIQLNNSDFCTLVANPHEMLRASVGEKIETSILSDFQCYCSRYADGEELYGFRSPHIAIGENAVLKNTYRDEWKWFNFTDRILIINLFGKGAFLSDTWQGCDTDSDVAYIGNDPTILEATKATVESGKYLVPINGLSPENDPQNYTNERMATIDGKLANDMIGRICNLARDLQCLYWHLYNTGSEENKEKYLPQIYDDICILAVASCIAIDSAKRRYKGVELVTELKKLKERPYLKAKGAILQNDGTITLVEKRYKKCFSEETIRKYQDCLKARNAATTEEEIQKFTDNIDEILMKEDPYMVRPLFTKGLKSKTKKKKKHFADEESQKLHQEKQILAAQERKELEEKIYIPLECTMDRLAKVIKQHLERAERTKLITFTEILNPIPKGFKADYNRITAVENTAIEWNNRLNQLYAKRRDGDISGEEMFQQKQNTIQNAINAIKYVDDDCKIKREVTAWDVHKMIRDVYDIHPEKDNHGKIKRVDGKVVMVDKRNKKLIGDKKKQCVGQKLLQWVYEAFPEEFMEVFKHNVGYVSYLEEVKESDSSSIQNMKDLKKWLDTREVFDLYGKKYRIGKKIAPYNEH